MTAFRGLLQRAIVPALAGMLGGIVILVAFGRMTSFNAHPAKKRVYEIAHTAHAEEKMETDARAPGLRGSSPRKLILPGNDDPAETADEVAQPAVGEDGGSLETGQIDAEAGRLQHEKLHARRIAEYEREPIDPVWARQTSDLLTTDLRTVADENDFTLVTTSCKTNLCMAELEWPNFSAAEETYTELAHWQYKANCGREILLPKPLDPSRPYMAKLIFDCTRWRTTAAIR